MFSDGAVACIDGVRTVHVTVTAMMTGWAGSLKCGVVIGDPAATRFDPNDNAVELRHAWVLSSGMYYNCANIREDYTMPDLRVGDRISMTIGADGMLRYAHNGVDMGVASEGLPVDDEAGYYVVVEPYGACAGVEMWALAFEDGTCIACIAPS